VGPGDTVYISGGTTSKTYNFSTAWTPPQGVQGNPVTITNGRDPGHTGTLIFNASGANTIIIGDFLNWVTFDFYHENTQKLRFRGYPTQGWYILGWSDEDSNDGLGFKLLGAVLESSAFDELRRIATTVDSGALRESVEKGDKRARWAWSDNTRIGKRLGAATRYYKALPAQ
jgi:hypothetical protein